MSLAAKIGFERNALLRITGERAALIGKERTGTLTDGDVQRISALWTAIVRRRDRLAMLEAAQVAHRDALRLRAAQLQAGAR